MGKKGKQHTKNELPNKKSQNDSKPKIDERFQAMFTDKNFKLKYVTDKRGRPVNYSSSKYLKEFYSVDTSESESDDELEKTSKESCKQNALENLKLTDKKLLVSKNDFEIDNKDNERTKSSDNEGTSSSESDDESGGDYKGSDTSTETSSDDDEDIDNSPDDEFDHKWEEWDSNAPAATEITRRLSLCNMDWDRIRAEDILAVFNSFKPANGIIHSVKIYPSEFGLKRMEEEKLSGPAELVEQTLDPNADGIKKDKEDSKYHREKLRQYQLNRLKYYYAVIECDSPQTADSLYEQLNGMEYENSAVCMDLRFIPDDITFDQEPKWVASSAPDPSEYKPRLFINSALQQVKVNLTWDETDPKRRETIKKAFTEPESIEKDIRVYLASSSSGSEDDSTLDELNGSNRKLKMEERIANYKALLQSLEEKEKEEENKYEMEITWDPGWKEKTEERVKEKIDRETMTPFEEKIKKKKEETKLRKKEKKMLLSKKNAEDSEESEFENVSDNEQSKGSKFRSNKLEQDTSKDNQRINELSLLVSEPNQEEITEINGVGKKTKKKNMMKRKKATETKSDSFEVDVGDNRFSAIYTSHLYNIDPSDPHFKDTKGMRAIVHEKLKKRKGVVEPNFCRNESKKRCKVSEDDSDIENSIVLI